MDGLRCCSGVEKKAGKNERKESVKGCRMAMDCDRSESKRTGREVTSKADDKYKEEGTENRQK